MARRPPTEASSCSPACSVSADTRDAAWRSTSSTSRACSARIISRRWATVPPGASEAHDGCVRADDVGGAIDGNHFDFFVGAQDRWLPWEGLFATGSTFSAYLNHPACFGY